MPFRSGSIGYSRFHVSGDAPPSPDDTFLGALAERTLSMMASDGKEIASGFCTGRHVFDGDFTYDRCGFGGSVLAALRIDTARVPAEIRRAYRSMAEDGRRAFAGGVPGALDRNARREAKEEAEERCRKDLAEGKYRRVSMVPFLWDLPSGALLAPLTSDAQLKELKGLLDDAFGVRLERRSAGTVALDILSERGLSSALDDALPDALVARPDGPAAGADEHGTAADFRRKGRPEVPWAMAAGEPNDFLGNLFLLWLWWHVDAREGIVETGDVTVALAIEKVLDMECAWGVTGMQSLRGDAPAALAEATKALQSGKWPRKMGLLLAVHGQDYRCTLQGDRFSVSGLALPAPDDDRPAPPRLAIEQRVDHVLTFDRVLTLLYGAFLNERFGARWESRSGELRDWIAHRDRRRRKAPVLAEVKPDAMPVG